ADLMHITASGMMLALEGNGNFRVHGANVLTGDVGQVVRKGNTDKVIQRVEFIGGNNFSDAVFHLQDKLFSFLDAGADRSPEVNLHQTCVHGGEEILAHQQEQRER